MKVNSESRPNVRPAPLRKQMCGFLRGGLPPNKVGSLLIIYSKPYGFDHPTLAGLPRAEEGVCAFSGTLCLSIIK